MTIYLPVHQLPTTVERPSDAGNYWAGIAHSALLQELLAAAERRKFEVASIDAGLGRSDLHNDMAALSNNHHSMAAIVNVNYYNTPYIIGITANTNMRDRTRLFFGRRFHDAIALPHHVECRKMTKHHGIEDMARDFDEHLNVFRKHARQFSRLEELLTRNLRTSVVTAIFQRALQLVPSSYIDMKTVMERMAHANDAPWTRLSVLQFLTAAALRKPVLEQPLLFHKLFGLLPT